MKGCHNQGVTNRNVFPATIIKGGEFRFPEFQRSLTWSCCRKTFEVGQSAVWLIEHLKPSDATA